jgi:HD superfamily phosphodiesterase
MLDGLGAMGIMRAFMSKSHLPPYCAALPFLEDSRSWPPDHVSDQLLFQMQWPERLNTETARQIARQRIAFMQRFIAQARDEIGAKTE